MRPNLCYRVQRTDDKRQALLRLLRQTKGTAIVYTRNRLRTEEIAQRLQAEGLPADYFHAGLPWAQKVKKQDQWSKEEGRIMVATNAFGMGIDKPDVRLVVHLDAPGSLEEYFQEAGRAGRDGVPADAITLFSPSTRPACFANSSTISPPSASFARCMSTWVTTLNCPLERERIVRLISRLPSFVIRLPCRLRLPCMP